MKFTFHTTCENPDAVGEYGEDINEMTQSPHMVDIHSDDFVKLAKKVGLDDVLTMFGHESEKQFKDDWGMSCHKSHFQGIDCLYIRFSGIEHIFVDSERYNELVTGQDAEQRRNAIEALDDLLEEFEPWLKAESPKEHYQALSQFVKENKHDFENNNILLASLFAYGHNYGDVVKRVDKENLLSKDTENEMTP